MSDQEFTTDSDGDVVDVRDVELSSLRTALAERDAEIERWKKNAQLLEERAVIAESRNAELQAEVERLRGEAEEALSQAYYLVTARRLVFDITRELRGEQGSIWYDLDGIVTKAREMFTDLAAARKVIERQSEVLDRVRTQIEIHEAAGGDRLGTLVLRACLAPLDRAQPAKGGE